MYVCICSVCPGADPGIKQRGGGMTCVEREPITRAWVGAEAPGGPGAKPQVRSQGRSLTEADSLLAFRRQKEANNWPLFQVFLRSFRSCPME